MKWVEENAGDPDIAKTVEKAKKVNQEARA